MEGRNTPSAGLKKAAAYLESEFIAMGLQPIANGKYGEQAASKKPNCDFVHAQVKFSI